MMNVRLDGEAHRELELLVLGMLGSADGAHLIAPEFPCPLEGMHL